jgi:hypothetical protein
MKWRVRVIVLGAMTVRALTPWCEEGRLGLFTVEDNVPGIDVLDYM